ncbi:hypothetical protein EG830_02260, partial [bacterium]|nr:hypothetical protein [bacterium]
MVSFLLKVKKAGVVQSTDELFIVRPEPALILTDDLSELFVWGDPIVDDKFSQAFFKDRSAEFLTDNASGHFYFVLLDKQRGKVTTGNSLFSILPVYYHETADAVLFSDNAVRLGKYCGKTALSGRFVTEVILFNYPLSDQSAIEGIKLLSSGSYLRIEDGRAGLVRHFSPEELFVNNPVPRKRAINDAAGSFLASSVKYFPEEPYFNSFTGGFDGRTLAAAGLFHSRPFTAVCFGSSTSGDLITARRATGEAGIRLEEISLDDEYVSRSSLDNGREFIMNASGTGSFERAHYLYSAKLLKNRGSCLVTGNFGSEIFRTAHVTGEMISKNLFHLFRGEDADSAFSSIQESREFRSLNRNAISGVWDEIKADLRNLPSFSADYRKFTRNQRFYIFVFNEVFRKYFGAEMINQFPLIRNRTPFLDINFLKTLFRSDLAGAYSDFYESNPFKRQKGQLLYAEIIRMAFPALGKPDTDKGYRPDDLLSLSGKARIGKNFIVKKVLKTVGDSDPNSVERAWQVNRDFWRSLPQAGDLFDSKIQGGAGGNQADSLFSRIYSINYLN